MYSLLKYFKYLTPVLAHKIYSNYNPAIKRYNRQTLQYDTIHTDCIFGPKNYDIRRINSFIMKMHYIQYDYFKKNNF